ncbi:uncharacterized protein A4U43_C07F12120, partial [Asparagus officinalis]
NGMRSLRSDGDQGIEFEVSRFVQRPFKCKQFDSFPFLEQLGARTSLSGLVAAKLGADVTLTDNSSRLEDQGGGNMMLQQLGGVNAIGFYKLCKVHQVMSGFVGAADEDGWLAGEGGAAVSLRVEQVSAVDKEEGGGAARGWVG